MRCARNSASVKLSGGQNNGPETICVDAWRVSSGKSCVMTKGGNETFGVWVEDLVSVLSTTPHLVAQSSCEQSPKDFAQHPAIGIMPALSIRQCDVAGTHKVSNSSAIPVMDARIRSDAIARRTRTSNESTFLEIPGPLRSHFAVSEKLRCPFSARTLKEIFALQSPT